MHGYTAVDLVLIITSIFTGVVSVVNAFKNSGNGKKIDTGLDKLDNIHEVTNGNLSKALAKVDELIKENQQLRVDISRFNERTKV